MTNQQIIEKLKSGKWSNKYFCKLVILDHLHECIQKDNYLKALDIPKTDDKYRLLDKELMDLKIALDLYFEDNKDLYTIRLNKFLENLNK